MFGFIRSWKRKRLAQRELPASFIPLITKHFPFAEQLEPAERERFLTHLKVFALEKHFEGAGGLEVTEEMKVVVAGSAARLARNLSLDVYDDLITVLIYPAAWKNPRGEGGHLGEAHQWGLVVLAWDAVREGLHNPGDGHDTALHEFAHVLDRGTGGAFDGTPELRAHDHYRPWATAMTKHFERLKKKDKKLRPVLRQYGATNEAEFFAVATEAFFERPDRLRDRAPDLYEALRGFYGDPLR